MRSGTTWLEATASLILRVLARSFELPSPNPTQLKGLKIVYGRPYWVYAALAKYSTANFWKPYMVLGGGMTALMKLSIFLAQNQPVS